MKLDERVKAATRVLCVDYESAACEIPCQSCRHGAEATIRAAFPELYGETPSAWIAPWEADDVMRRAAQDRIVSMWPPESKYPEATTGDVFAAMRDSHLSKPEAA